MDMLKLKVKLKALKWILLKYGKTEDIQAQDVVKVFLFNIDYMYVVISRGMQHYRVDQSQSAY
jgi:hypothetical protein